MLTRGNGILPSTAGGAGCFTVMPRHGERERHGHSTWHAAGRQGNSWNHVGHLVCTSSDMIVSGNRPILQQLPAALVGRTVAYNAR